MARRLAALVLLLVPLLAFVARPAVGAGSEAAPRALPQARSHTVPAAGWERIELPESGSRAWRYVPTSAAATVAAGERLPVVVFLHGSGSNPEEWRPYLNGPAEAAGVVVVAPAPADPFGWGIAEDTKTLDEAVERVAAELPVDRRRIALAGHSAGGAYALVVAYGTAGRWSAVFSFSAPFRNLLGLADPAYTPPARLWYGQQDPNFLSGHLSAIAAMLEHRGVDWQAETVAGLGHSGIRPQDLTDGFTFLAARRRPKFPNRLVPKRND
jgi:poly(3-hydroxybutyrate) depolymerase